MENKTKEPTVYYCNPFKAEGCSKTGCHLNGGECEMTTRLEWALMPIPVDQFPHDGVHPDDQMVNDLIYGFDKERLIEEIRKLKGEKHES